MDCLDADVAAGYAEHRLGAVEVTTVEAHIDGCATCRELVSAIARLAYTGPVPPDEDLAATGAIGGVLPRGTRIGPFELDEPLDAGGMGLVYAAHDTRLDRRVAVKCVRDLGGDPAQLMQEARMMAQLAHPNVVPVHDVIEERAQLFLAMELVVGRNVRRWLDEAARGWREIVDVFLAAGAGLAAAHAAGIVHGDVKPANILVGDDARVRITDFGLARTRRAATDPGVVAPVRGTPAYMPPEQRAGRGCDARGDQYALCASIHEALFGAPSRPRTVVPPGRPAVRAPRVPRRLRRCLARGLAVDPGDRYPSVDALLRDLRATRSARRRWTIGAAVGALAIAALAFAIGEHRAHATLCGDAVTRLASPWDAEARGAVHRQLGRAAQGYAGTTLERVDANLDAWSADLDATRDDVCHAGWLDRAPPREQLDATIACLETRAGEGRELIEQLREADAATMRHAADATADLPRAARCVDVPPRPVRPPDSASLQHVRELFARAYALGEAGKSRAQLGVAQEAFAAAQALGDPSVEASARVELASAQGFLSDFDAAEANLRVALRLSERAQDDRTRAQAWFYLVQIANERGHYAECDALLGPALGAAERVGDLWLQSEILLNVGGARSQLGRLPEAQAMFEEAVAMRRKLFHGHDSRLAAALSALGNAYAMQGRLDDGIAAHAEAVRIAEAAVGPDHPSMGTLRGNLGTDYLWALRLPEAQAELDHAAAILAASDGEQPQELASTLTDSGVTRLEAGDAAGALAVFERADALWAKLAPDSPERTDALRGRYLAHVALGQPADLADLQVASKLAAPLPPFMRARFEMALGEATSDAMLVTTAAADFATSTLPLAQRDRAACLAWLAAHGAAGRAGAPRKP